MIDIDEQVNRLYENPYEKTYKEHCFCYMPEACGVKSARSVVEGKVIGNR